MAKTSGLHGKERVDPKWSGLINGLNRSSLGFSAASIATTIIGGPVLLLIALGAVTAGTAAAKQIRLHNKRRRAMYLLRDQEQNLVKLRDQLNGGDDVLIACYSKGGKTKEVFVGDKREPYPGIPESEIMSLDEILKAADKDAKRDPVVLFFGRPL